ncbi:hypothetical protein ACVWZK_002088 [Bradyrhizobium sp. GM0.4]|jgi:hypothetical protein
MRANSRSAGAAAPIVWYVGSIPIISDPAHISSTDSTIEFLRPCASAIQPNSQPPSGRMKNPTAKMPAVASNWLVWSPDGKNAAAK